MLTRRKRILRGNEESLRDRSVIIEKIKKGRRFEQTIIRRLEKEKDHGEKKGSPYCIGGNR